MEISTNDKTFIFFEKYSPENSYKKKGEGGHTVFLCLNNGNIAANLYCYTKIGFNKATDGNILTAIIRKMIFLKRICLRLKKQQLHFFKRI